MSEDIINAIRLLVEDGAEVTYTRESQQPTDYYQGITAGRLTERERIIQLLESHYKPEDTKTICTINHEQYLDLIDLIRGEQK